MNVNEHQARKLNPELFPKASKRANPAVHVKKCVPAVAGQLRKAASIYERFTGHDPRKLGPVNVPALPKAAALIGDCDGIMYSTVRDGKLERYIHEFAESDRPMLAITPNGQQILLIGGKYKFTDRGIVDKSDKGE